jgi:hypothetical protein
MDTSDSIEEILSDCNRYIYELENPELCKTEDEKTKKDDLILKMLRMPWV